jgi:hypothetical protein
LQSYRISCQRKRQESEKLNNEISRLETLVNRFKIDDREYLKIQKMVEEEVNKFLSDGKVLLQFALASVIESLRRNPELCNFVLNDISNNNNSTIYTSNYHSLIMSEQEQPFIYISDDIYTAVILEEDEKLYNNLTTKLTNDVIAAATAIKETSLSLLSPSGNNNNQKLIYENGTYDETQA